MEKILIGSGGFSREIIAEVGEPLKRYVDDDAYWQEGLYKLSEFNPETQIALIAVGNPTTKRIILSRLPKETKFWNYISPRSYVKVKTMGVGNFICAGTIVTTDVTMGNHIHLNLNTTIGHDAVLGDFVTTAPSVNISGNVNVGEVVYFGTNSCVKEKVNICPNVIIGLNSGVIKDITESGTYVGTPVKKIK